MPRAVNSRSLTGTARNARTAPILDELNELRDAAQAPNTRVQYELRVKKFKDYCDRIRSATGHTVTPEKVLHWIYTEVLFYENKNLTKKQQLLKAAQVEDESVDYEGLCSDQETRTLAQLEEDTRGTDDICLDLRKAAFARLRRATQGPASIGLHVAAVVDLWASQVHKGMNDYPSPRTDHIRVLKSTMERMAHQRRVDTFQDKSINTMWDGYQDLQDVAKTFEHFMVRDNEEGLRDAVANAWGLYGMMRSDNQRLLRLSDLASFVWINEGVDPMLVVMAVMRQGKVNKHGKELSVGFHFGSDLASRVPDLSARSEWYDDYLLSRAGNETVQISYDAQRKAQKAALRYASVGSSKATHVNRKGGARLAENAGVETSDIARLGKWNTDVLDSVYMTQVPRAPVRGLAGFNAKGGDYHLPRDVEVDDELLRMVFPWIESRLVELSTRQGDAVDRQAIAFVTLCTRLRKVIIQDAPLWIEKFPRHYVFQHPLFQSPQFMAFRLRSPALRSARTHEHDHSLANALPLLSSMLKGFHSRQEQHNILSAAKLSDLAVSASKQMDKTNNSLRVLSTIIGALSKPISVPAPLQAQAASLQQALLDNTDPQQSTPPSALLETVPALIPLLAPFRMSRKTASVRELLREWRDGVGGYPSVQTVYEHGGFKFTKEDETERRFYCRRRFIMDVLEELAKRQKISESEAAEKLDSFRERQKATNGTKAPASLNHLEGLLRHMSSDQRLLL